MWPLLVAYLDSLNSQPLHFGTVPISNATGPLILLIPLLTSGDLPNARALIAIHEKLHPAPGSGDVESWQRYNLNCRYEALARVIANSNDPYRVDFAFCGFPGLKYRFSCGDTLLCPRCAFNRRSRKLRDRFVRTAFASGYDVYFVVLTLSRNPDAESREILKDEINEVLVRRFTAPIDNHVKLQTLKEVLASRTLFKGYTDVIWEYSPKGGFIAGAVGGPELSVQFLPLGTVPHADFIIFVPPMDHAQLLEG